MLLVVGMAAGLQTEIKSGNVASIHPIPKPDPDPNPDAAPGHVRKDPGFVLPRQSTVFRGALGWRVRSPSYTHLFTRDVPGAKCLPQEPPAKPPCQACSQSCQTSCQTLDQECIQTCCPGGSQACSRRAHSSGPC